MRALNTRIGNGNRVPARAAVVPVYTNKRGRATADGGSGWLPGRPCPDGSSSPNHKDFCLTGRHFYFPYQTIRATQ